MEYTKPHLTFEQQLQRLRDRGLECMDEESALCDLRLLGYYRLSAYAYPFRELIPADTPRETSVQLRTNRFVAGTTFEVVSSLADFDRRLRLCLLDNLETIELALRVQVAYVLGRRSAFGHLSGDSLDTKATSRVSRDEGTSVYEEWLRKYRILNSNAVEDFVTHYREKYDGRLPIWVAIEMLDFGALVRLLGFMLPSDQTEIARNLGIPNARHLRSIVKVLNYVRNVSAHHSRLWNRNLTYRLPAFPPEMVGDLDHLARLTHAARAKVYGAAAVTKYLVSTIDTSATSSSRLIDVLDTFPSNDMVSMETDMGFPDDWRALHLWKKP